MEDNTKPKRDLLLPGSILIAALLISGSLIYNVGKRAENFEAPNGNKPISITLEPVSNKDHILGNPDAQVKIVEFSDLECPFCKQFHPVLHKIVEDYKGQVAWVYRQFPIDELHSRARNESEASECAAELGGNSKFWAYIDRVFEITPTNNGLDPKELLNVAEAIGLDRSSFESCLESERHAARVEADINDAIKAGARGTPYSVVVNKDGEQYPINGYLSYAKVKAVIDEALK